MLPDHTSLHRPAAPRRPALPLLALSLSTLLGSQAAPAQTYPVTPAQRATAAQVAQAGVPLSELSPDAPDSYTVVRRDTLWGISRLFLKSPWRWPELWGMNLQGIRNPHLIYPGQRLVLDKKDGRATLRLAGAEAGTAEQVDTAEGLPVVRLSPRVRAEALGANPVPTLQPHLIEPFLSEPVILGENALQQAPRLVAGPEGRVLLTRGDRAYARGSASQPLALVDDRPSQWRVFREARPLRDPESQAILGYEAQYLGQARLQRGESALGSEIVPATVDLVSAKEEMRVGDRLLPEPERELLSYQPHAPQTPVDGRIVSVYGSAVTNAAQNQVVVINKGTADGMERGHVLAILKNGRRLVDRTDPERPTIRLPDERNGLLMVFRPFERLSYALILEINDSVRVGDRLATPR